MWYHNQDKVLQSSFWGNQDKSLIRTVSKSYLLCYTRERAKREEKAILQHQTTSRYIHFVCHPWIIPHASMYHLNILPWFHTPPTQLLINTATPPHPTSQHLRPLPHHNKLYSHHLTTLPHHLRFYQHLDHAVTLIPSEYPILFLSTIQSITRNPSHDSCTFWFHSHRLGQSAVPDP